jgi:hypothetical protein
MCSGPDTDRRALDDAVCATVIYADLFDFALDPIEIDRDLVFVDASSEATSSSIDRQLRDGRLGRRAGLIVLPGREELVDLRRLSQRRAAAIWPIARRLGRVLATIPFVRGVGITGSLAAENPGIGADIDYCLLTAPGRLWLARAGAIIIVRHAQLFDWTICPNYLLATTALPLDRMDLYTAHEILQTVPLAGPDAFRSFLVANAWTGAFLPHRARVARLPRRDPLVRRLARGAGEAALHGWLGERLDHWEWQRKSPRLAKFDRSARFTREVCEGHYGQHRATVLENFDQLCRVHGVSTDWIRVGAGT